MRMPQRVLRRRLVTSAKPMCTFDKVLNQRVDWVAWASIRIYGARDAIDDACTTSSAGAIDSFPGLLPPSPLHMLASDNCAWVYVWREKAWYILSRDACRDCHKASSCGAVT